MPGHHDQPDDPAARAPEREIRHGERVGGMLVHLLGTVTVFLAPLVMFIAHRNRSDFVRGHSVQALNFQIGMAVAYVVAGSLVLVPVVWLPIVWLIYLVVFLYDIGYAIKAAGAAHRGDRFRYPVAVPFIKA